MLSDNQAPVNYRIHVIVALSLAIFIQLLAMNANTGKISGLTSTVNKLKANATGKSGSSFQS